MIPGILAVKNGQLEKLGKSVSVMDASDVTVKLPENKQMYFAADGEVFDMAEHGNSLTIRVMPTTLKFVVPSGVALKEQCREGD